MKLFNSLLFSVLTGLIALGQNEISQFYKTVKSKTPHYIERINEDFKVYQMGVVTDKAGTGYSIIQVDTLNMTTEGQYTGKTYKLSEQNGQFTLHSGKGKPMELEITTDVKQVYSNLNNAYYLKGYFTMVDSLNAQFPLSDYSYKSGFIAWNDLQNKTDKHEEFKRFADSDIEDLYSHIRKQQNQLTNTMDFLIQNAMNVNYDIIRDSLNTIVKDNLAANWRFEKAIYEIAKKKPDYFFRIAEDFYEQRKMVFSSVGKDKELRSILINLDGHENLKKEFKKHYRQNKTRPYKMAGGFLILVAIIVSVL